jgi:hypothetical protein
VTSIGILSKLHNQDQFERPFSLNFKMFAIFLFFTLEFSGALKWIETSTSRFIFYFQTYLNI